MNNIGGLWRLAPLLIGLLVMAVMAARGCQEGPFGRSQLVRLAPEEENALGAQAFEQVLSEARQKGAVIERGATVDAIKGIGRRLAAATANPRFRERTRLKGERRFDWEFRLLADRQVNAFCLPGGKVVVFTGILPVAQTETGLAVVMGHEIGHALARHGAERMAQNELVQVGQVAVASSLGGLDYNTQRAILGTLSAGTQLGLLSYSRDHEREADHLGVLLMAAAGYDPRSASQFWLRMERASGGNAPPPFLSTHPPHGERMQNLSQWAATEALDLYQASDKQPDRDLPPVGQPARPKEPAKSGMKGKGYEFK